MGPNLPIEKLNLSLMPTKGVKLNLILSFVEILDTKRMIYCWLAGKFLKDATGKWNFGYVAPEGVEQFRHSFSRILFADGPYEISSSGGDDELLFSFVRNPG